MHRFFVSPEAIRNNRVLLRGPIVHQLRDVLRMHAGDAIVLLDNSGWAFRAELVMVELDVVRGRIVEKWRLATEPRARITLYQSLLKGQKFDLVLQKGTELGVIAFVPVIAARCLVGSVDDVSDLRVERWQKIIVEAAEQARRACVPNLSNAILFTHACQTVAEKGLSLIPWEGERSRGLREALQVADPRRGRLAPRIARGSVERPATRGGKIPKSKEINLFIGPEGGFTEEEISTAESFGIVPLSLGPRILRAETAGLAASAAILYEFGDLG